MNFHRGFTRKGIMKKEGANPSTWESVKLQPLFTCGACGKPVTHWIDVSQDSDDAGNERWEPSCKCQEWLRKPVTARYRFASTFLNTRPEIRL